MIDKNTSSKATDPKFILPPNAVPAELVRLTDPRHVAERLAMPVAPGQLWIAESEEHDSMQYVMVTAIGEDSRIVMVVPLSNNVADRTEGALVVGNTPMGMPMVAWPELTTGIPIRLLSKPMDEFRTSIAKALIKNRADSRISVKRAQPMIDPPYSTERRFEEMRERLADWHAMCDRLPVLHAEDDIVYETSSDRAAYAKALKDVLHLTPAQRLAVSDGRLQLSDAQQRQLADAGYADVPTQQAVISDEYLIMAEQPRWRAVADAISDTTDEDPRLALAHKAQFELAARISGHGEKAVMDAFEQAAAIIRDETDE